MALPDTMQTKMRQTLKVPEPSKTSISGNTPEIAFSSNGTFPVGLEGYTRQAMRPSRVSVE